MEKVSHTSHLAQIKCNKVCYVYRQCWNTNRHIIERLVYCQCPELYKVLFVLLAVCTPNNEKSCFLHFKSWPFYVKVDRYWWYMCYNPLGFSKKDLKCVGVTLLSISYITYRLTNIENSVAEYGQILVEYWRILVYYNYSGKWGDEEIEMLRSAVNKFGEDLKKISEIIKTKSMYVFGTDMHDVHGM